MIINLIQGGPARTPKAVLGANGNLNFLNDSREYTVGQTYTDNLEETEIKAVYPIDPSSTTQPDWSRYVTPVSITSANITKKFNKVKPVSFLKWFNKQTIVSFTNLQNLNTSEATTMESMFQQVASSSSQTSLEFSDISNWDTSKVTSFKSMFEQFGRFITTMPSIDLSNWDIGSATDISSMFSNMCSSSTNWSVGDLSNWDTSDVTTMSSLFSSAGDRTVHKNVGDLSNWDTSNVTSMSNMFACSMGTSTRDFYIGDIGNWDTQNVTTMISMFHWFNPSSDMYDFDLSDWDVSNVENLASTFAYFAHDISSSSGTVTINLNNWDTSKVINMYNTFQSCNAVVLGVDDFNVDNVTNMNGTFRGFGKSTQPTIDLSNWNTGNVTDMSYMFLSSTQSYFDGIGSLDVHSVKSMKQMFSRSNMPQVLDLSSWQTPALTDISWMFEGVSYSSYGNNEIILSQFDTSNVTDMSYMFKDSTRINTVEVGNDWSTDSVNNSTDMFASYNSMQLVGGKGTAWSAANPTDKTYAHIDGGSDNPGYFTGPYTGLKFKAKEAGASITYTVTGSLPDLDMKYSLDKGKTWNSWDGSAITLSNIDDEICVKGDNPGGVSKSNANYMKFSFSKNVAASGNINSLLDDEDGSTITTIPCDYCYVRLFESCLKLIAAPELPATTLTLSCYSYMFSGCRITQAPDLPATVVTALCYRSMFERCSSLIKPPELPAITLVSQCYQEMFYSCTSLAQAPELPATTLAYGCYSSMFNGCTSLKVKENDSTDATKIFDYTTSSFSDTNNMFTNTAGSFTGTPTQGNSYYWYT